jgi:hypothetical protein
MKTYGGGWRYSSTILGLGTRWRWVVSFTLWPLYSRGNYTRYALDITSVNDSIAKYTRDKTKYTARPCRNSAVRRWLPTAAARVRLRAACGVCGGQSGTGAGFLRVLRFSPANHSTDFSIIIITRGWYNRPLSGRSVEWTLIPPPTMLIKKKIKSYSNIALWWHKFYNTALDFSWVTLCRCQ